MDNIISIVIVSITLLFILFVEKQKWRPIKVLLQWFPAILFAYLIPALITHSFDLSLEKVSLHDWSKKLLIPIAILTIMGSMSIKSLRVVAGKPLILFFLGSFTIAILPVIIIYLSIMIFPSSKDFIFNMEYWKGLIPIVGSWIGGSTSQLVLKEYVGTSEQMFLSILILDNILVNIWTMLMFQLIKQSKQINQNLNLPETIVKNEDEISDKPSKLNSVITIFTSIFTILLFLYIDFSFILTIILLTLIGIIFSNLIPLWNHNLNLKIGSITILLVMAVLGLKLNFTNFELPAFFVLIVLVWIVSQLFISILICYMLNLSIVWVPIANMANLGGISTAPAVTSAYKKELMPHAIVLAILSMITGTFWGIISTFLIKLFL